jgi:flagellum-specific peptidoglycan hydrolase FlgJ
MGPLVAPRHHARRLPSLHGLACALGFSLSLFSFGALAAEWGCFSAKPGHPTPAERVAFVREISELAVKAERTHGVPASALAAIAIAESGYGWTRIAIEANNLFAWKFGSQARKEGRKPYAADCHRKRGLRDRYVAFASRAEAFDHVAAKLATLSAYRRHTEAYRAARLRGEPPDKAVQLWLSGIADRYAGDPAAFMTKMLRIINNPVDAADPLPPEQNLYRLSAAAGHRR